MVTFKTQRQEAEWKDAKVSARLKKLVEMVADFVELIYKRDIMITELLRTQAEQDRIYAADEKYKKAPWKSVHQEGRGCDLRTKDMTNEQVQKILALANMVPYREGKVTALQHDVGAGMHIHIQVIS